MFTNYCSSKVCAALLGHDAMHLKGSGQQGGALAGVAACFMPGMLQEKAQLISVLLRSMQACTELLKCTKLP